MVFDTDFGGVFDLFVAAAKRGDQTRRSHRTGHADFALAADLGTGDRGIAFAQHADRGRTEQEVAHTLHRIARIAVFDVVAQHGRNDAGRTIGRRRDDPATGGVFFVD